jgi:hypothetical protein
VAAPAAVAPAAPAAPACYGELCGDDAAMGYVDDGSHTDLLSADPDDWAVDVGSSDPAAQFVGGSDEAGDDLGAQLDALDTMLVEIRTDKPGVQVMIDGAPAGVTPVHTDLSGGYHTVKLIGDNGEQTFQLRPESDPQAWCFESKGRGFKLDRCR